MKRKGLVASDWLLSIGTFAFVAMCSYVVFFGILEARKTNTATLPATSSHEDIEVTSIVDNKRIRFTYVVRFRGREFLIFETNSGGLAAVECPPVLPEGSPQVLESRIDKEAEAR